MEIIRGSLDDISRPASSEQPGSRVSSVSVSHSDRLCPKTPFSLVVLTNDGADIQDQSSFEETIIRPSTESPDKDGCDVEASDREKDDAKLQRAIKEMTRLDEILSTATCKAKEVRRQRKEFKAKLWHDLLQNKPKGRSECSPEAVNTRLFLALEEVSTGPEKEAIFVPVFNTQVPDCELDRDGQHALQSKKTPKNVIESFEADYGKLGGEQFEGSHYGCGASDGKKKQRDFVKRNIELVSDEGGGQAPLTQVEKERLAELLREIDEEEEDSARGADREEDIWTVSVVTGQGYTPQPSDLEQLIDIDSKIRLLLPVDESFSVRSSYTNTSMSQGLAVPFGAVSVPGVDVPHQDALGGVKIPQCLRGYQEFPQASEAEQSLPCLPNHRVSREPPGQALSDADTKGHSSEAIGWKRDGDPQPGEKVLQDIKERRGQERRLQEIQEQLEMLGEGQEMTDEPPDLTEEQLHILLDECELTERWGQELEMSDTTPQTLRKYTNGPDPPEAWLEN